MIHIIINRNKKEEITGFTCSGHARYAEAGKDIICSAVSTLCVNTINSLEKFTDSKIKYDVNYKSGMINFKLVSNPSNETKLLLNSMVLGITGIIKEYGNEYIELLFKEV